MNRTLAYGILFLFVGIVIGYSVATLSSPDEGPVGLQIPETSSSIGSVDPDNTDRQVLSYEFNLYNYRDEAVYLNSVEPVFSSEFSEIILTNDTGIVVDRTIESGSPIKVSGQVEFDATGLSKEEILDVTDRSIVGFRVSSTETVYYPWAEN